ncbi:hypothetical protein H0H81_004256 [Sphagnurus paluster]|uniref:BED-type domain-containing protein n=1 Tax=Sphagnurus paluster TaxID=117069 RepID=A0A9P7GG39_9AGAR|nr:hypothetical protein H0H81_004256 [Sphagnurus paluster]
MAPQVATCPRCTASHQPAHNASPKSEDFDWSPVCAVIKEEGAEDAFQIQDVAMNPSKKKQAHNIARFFKTEDITDGSKMIKKKVCQICKTAPSCNVNYQYSTSTGNTVLRAHLCRQHAELYTSTCQEEGWSDYLETEQSGHDANHASGSAGRHSSLMPFTQEGFVDALVKFISINVVECCEFRDLLLYMRDGLEDEDIPRRTKVTTSIMKAFKKYFQDLIDELQAALGDISFTADLWSSKTRYPYFAVTAHWVARKDPLNLLSLCSGLIAFHCVQGKHSGEQLARITLMS